MAVFSLTDQEKHFGSESIEAAERGPLITVGVLSASVGLVGGLFLFDRLNGDVKLQAGYWTTLLTVSALASLPLVATVTHLARLLKKPGNDKKYTRWAPLAMFTAAALSLLSVVLCLFQVATTSGKSDPNDLVVFVTSVIVCTSVGATVFGIAAGILDKIDDP